VRYSSVGIYIQYDAARGRADSLVLGYRWLYEVPKILHRDISLNNLMLRKEDGHVYAVLNDLDLAVNADVQRQSSKHRTGTTPFMAIDLLDGEPTVHFYRHDLESLFYVLVWITSRFHDGVEIANPPLKAWTEGKHQNVMDSKSAFLRKRPLKPTERFASFGRHISRMRRMFSEGLVARTIALEDSRYNPAPQGGPEILPFADDTLGGLVTFDTFQTILDADLP
jgi:serine/threonine protein kinase